MIEYNNINADIADKKRGVLMKFNIKQKELEASNHDRASRDLAYKFSSRLCKEFGAFVKGIILFGSAARSDSKAGDIDVLVIVDDISLVISPDVAEAYRIIVEKSIVEISKRLHVTTLKFTSFWEYVRVGDPVGINILRDGFAIVDTGFFTPLKALLVSGRIRPSPESVMTYYSRAPKTLFNSKWHILQATLDLYWAAIDAAHAALMRVGEVPPSPSRAAAMLDVKLAKKGLISRKMPQIMDMLYKLSKKIIHREVQEISGKEFNNYYKDAELFVDAMKDFILGRKD